MSNPALDQIGRIERELAALRAMVQSGGGDNQLLAGFVWPSSFHPSFITQFFRANPQDYARFGLPGHEGLDIRTGVDGRALCIYAGVVARVDAWPNTGAYGYSVRVYHAEVKITSVYAHLDPAMSVPAVGTIVAAGAVLGRCDSTGNARAAHLHLSIKDEAGQFVDPLMYLSEAYRAAGGTQELPDIGAPIVLKKS
jgi:murein DD-endopeptidase MepM/ murein hydrolase activator NlpD